MREDTADHHAKSHAGQHGDFEVFWGADEQFEVHPLQPGWYWWYRKLGHLPDGDPIGPFATSQAAFGDYKDKIDEE